MCVTSLFADHALSLRRFDELPCHMTQALCRETTTNHLIRMVEQGRLQATKLSPPTPSDVTFKEWVANIASLNGSIPPPSVHIHHSTESPPLPFAHWKLRDPITAAWLSPADSLIVIHLLLQERSKSGIGIPNQCTMYLSQRDQIPREVCQVNIPGLGDCDKIEGYGHSELEARVSACFSACQLLQMSGMLEPTHFPALSPFVPAPRVIEPQQLKAKSNGVSIHPRRSPPFWSLSTETLWGLWYPTTIMIGGPMEDFGLLAILTRHPLPAIGDFRLFISGNPVNVRLRKCQPGPFSSNELEKLRLATLRVLRFVGNKPFVADLNHLPYLLFPLQNDAALLNFLHNSYPTSGGLPLLGSPCESEIVTGMAASAFLPIMTNTTEEITKDLYDAVIQDRKIEYTKHYFVDKIRQDLTPLHKPQEGEVSVLRFGFHPRSHLTCTASARTRKLSRTLQGPHQEFSRHQEPQPAISGSGSCPWHYRSARPLSKTPGAREECHTK